MYKFFGLLMVLSLVSVAGTRTEPAGKFVKFDTTMVPKVSSDSFEVVKIFKDTSIFVRYDTIPIKAKAQKAVPAPAVKPQPAKKP